MGKSILKIAVFALLFALLTPAISCKDGSHPDPTMALANIASEIKDGECSLDSDCKKGEVCKDKVCKERAKLIYGLTEIMIDPAIIKPRPHLNIPREALLLLAPDKKDKGSSHK